MIELIRKLSEAHSPPGFEDEVRTILTQELEPYCEIEVDVLGNLIAKKGKGEKKIMLASHMDEIGLMVKHIDEKGFLKFTTIGYSFDQTLLDQRVVIHTKKGKHIGIVGYKSAFFMDEKEREKLVKCKDMCIDIGASNPEEVKKLGINIGDYITFDTNIRKLHNNIVTGKAFDDRIGCAVLIEVMKKIKTQNTVYAVGTTQEEVGLKGVRTSAFKVTPDIALALDVCPAGDHPSMKDGESNIKLNKGPVITLVEAKGRGLITHSKIKNLIVETAEEYKIPYQLEVGESGVTDASAMQLTKEGILSGAINVPTRYIHTPVCVASLKDIENTIKLVCHVLEKI